MQLSSSEKNLVWLLRFWIFAFGITTAIFIFWQNPFLELINSLSAKFTPALIPIAIAQEKFWLVLTLSLMVTLVFMCIWGQNDIKKNHWVLPAILVSKFTSTFFFFLFFILVQKSLAYMVGVLSDGFVFLVTLIIYQKAKPYLASQGV